MKLRLFQINDDPQELEISILGWKPNNVRYYGWLLIIYFPKDGSKVYLRGLLS